MLSAGSRGCCAAQAAPRLAWRGVAVARPAPRAAPRRAIEEKRDTAGSSASASPVRTSPAASRAACCCCLLLLLKHGPGAAPLLPGAAAGHAVAGAAAEAGGAAAAARERQRAPHQQQHLSSARARLAYADGPVQQRSTCSRPHRPAHVFVRRAPFKRRSSYPGRRRARCGAWQQAAGHASSLRDSAACQEVWGPQQLLLPLPVPLLMLCAPSGAAGHGAGAGDRGSNRHAAVQPQRAAGRCGSLVVWPLSTREAQQWHGGGLGRREHEGARGLAGQAWHATQQQLCSGAAVPRAFCCRRV